MLFSSIRFQYTLFAAAILLFPQLARAACAPGVARPASSLHFQLENDILSGSGQDQGYSSGLNLTWVSSDLTDPATCLPTVARAIHPYLRWLQPGGNTQQNLMLAFEQTLYTPQDKTRRDLIRTDRPYAAMLAIKLGYQARQAQQLRTNWLTLGVVGPAALGKTVQNDVHHILGNKRVRGWGNQLRNEPIVQWTHERRYRLVSAVHRNGWAWDVTGVWGGALGNAFTWLNAGSELRYGMRLPDDFGAGRLAGVDTASAGWKQSSAWAGYLFLALDTRAVARDISLDGNTWRNSHKVDTRHLVTELGYGLVMHYQRWKVTLARYHRTREFNGQSSRPVFGSIRIGYQF